MIDARDADHMTATADAVTSVQDDVDTLQRLRAIATEQRNALRGTFATLRSEWERRRSALSAEQYAPLGKVFDGKARQIAALLPSVEQLQQRFASQYQSVSPVEPEPQSTDLHERMRCNFQDVLEELGNLCPTRSDAGPVDDTQETPNDKHIKVPTVRLILSSGTRCV